MEQRTYKNNGAISTLCDRLKCLRSELRGARLFLTKYSEYLSTGQSSCFDLVGLSADSKNLMSVHLVHVLADIDNLETYINGKLILYEQYEEF